MTSFNLFSQNYRAFNPVADGTFSGIKGDMLLIGNNIMNRSAGPLGANNPYNGTGNNNDFNMQYIDVDTDATTFNSSTADLSIPVATQGCYQIRSAILYWAGVYNTANIGNQVDRSRLNQVKFRLPGAATYTDLTGQILFDSWTVGAGVSGATRPGYVAYQDVTALVQGLANANGTYGVANIQSGLNTNTSGGWTLYIVYEDPLTTAKNITLFDGFSNILSGSPPLDIPITGFTSIPVGPVRAKLAFAALEGDRAFTNDRLRINGTSMTIPTRPANNFFNATINDINGAFTTRNLNSSNLLGFDAGLLNVPNPGNGIIANNATSATIRLETQGDSYVYYLNAFAIEVIQPQINLVKTVTNLTGTNVGNQTVNLGQELFYDLSFQNIGNDDAINFTLTDVLPVNVSLLNIDLSGAPGVTITSLPGASPIVFSIPNSLVTQGGATYNIRIRVRVAENCYDLRDACSNEITNQAFKTYSSLTSGNVVENQQPSASGIDACLFPTPGATNFIADIDDCTFESEEILCGTSVTLTAGGGYLSYQWYNGPNPSPATLIAGATNQSYVANSIGTYSVVNTAPAPCLSITETFNVVNFTGFVPNPVIPYADQVDTCPNDGTELPKIFLCGASDSRLIQTNILNATSIVWQVLDEASCPAVTNTSCANTNTACTWNSAGPNGPNFNAVDAGQYRVTITFQNGCFRTYYFNVFKNLFTPTAVATDRFCTTQGTITVNGVPSSGYEFSIDNVNWFPTNVFNPVPPGVYTVYVRQIGGGVGNCLFTIPNVQVLDRNFTVNLTVNNALCNGTQGSIRVQVNNVRPQYTYVLTQGAVTVNNSGLLNTNDYTFPNLNPGNYTVNVTTTDGCTFTQNVTITEPALLTLSGTVTRPLTCIDPVTGLYDGQITLNPVGGTPPYIYTISTDPGNIYSNDPAVFDITAPGTYTFTVTDFNNCTDTTTIVVDAIPPPVFTITQTDILCNGGNSGQIVFNVTNTNGYTIQYSIDGGGTLGNNPVFSNLPEGTYNAQLQYTLNGVTCPPIQQTIIITEPANAVTASAGVSELAGCGPMGEGRVRITNPEGGSGVYEYSFNGGLTWGTASEAYLAPGTYSVCIRDANSITCTFCTNVTIDPAPQDPTITVAAPDYNCDGTATTTVTVNSGTGNFQYEYYIDNVLNTNVPPNVFENVSCGPHNITVRYRNLIIPTYSDLLREDFGSGNNTTTPGIAAAYCWNSQPYPATTPCGNNPIPGFAPVCGSYTIEDNQYSVTSAIIPNNCSWFDYRDHTQVLTGTPDPRGRFLAVNIGSAAGNYGILYSKEINSVLPNQPVLVDLYVANLLRAGVAGADPDFILELVDPSGTVVASQATGVVDNLTDGWQLQQLSLNPGNNTTLTFNIRSGSILFNGNDAAIDDIYVRQEPIVCIEEAIFPILIDCNAAFTAQITSASNVTCNGANDGQITIAAQNFDPTNGYFYSLTGAAPFTQVFTSPITLTGLAAGTYNVVIQYDLTSTPCSFPFTQEITQPTALVADAVLTSPATCTTGGVITASASGGTPNYQYQLQDGVGGIIIAFQGNPVFSNLAPGTYVVVVRDALSCTDPIDVPITIGVPTPPTAVIDGSSDLCYDGVNQATIVVTASGGVAPYTYSINGSAPPQTNNTFTGLTPGTYTIVVTDSYNCTVTLAPVTIAPQLNANAVITKALDCTASPDAVITITINGGTSSYNYEVFFNGSSLGTFPVTSNPFTYSTPNAGNYQFTITDFTGCTVTTTPVTVSPLPILNPPVATQTASNLCNGDNNGAFSVTASGGLPPYTYSINGTTFQNGNTFSGLTAGTYTVTVRDANMCIQTTSITLVQPDPIAFTIVDRDIQCGPSGTEPGSIDVINVTGGTAGFTYFIRNSTGTYSDSFVAATGQDHSFTILNFGIYTVTVVDANGCQLTQNNIVIASPPNSLIIDVSTPTANCTTGGTIEVCVSSALGGGPYYFAIYQDLAPAIPPYPTFPSVGYQPADITGLCSTFTGLIPGVTYSFIVFDAATNCYYFETAPGPVPTPSSITSTVTPNNVTCTGAADGSVTFTVSGYSGTSVSYQIYQALNNTTVGGPGTNAALTGASFTVNNFGVLAPGQYYVLFTENNGPNAGCTQVSANFTISESPVPLSVTATVTRNDNDCTLNAGQITVTGANGTPPYTYQIVLVPGPAPTTWPGQASNVFNVEGGTYTIYIQDANGCVRTATTTVTVPTDTSPDITLVTDPATLCNTNDGNYSIVVTTNNTVGVPPFTYSLDGGAFTTASTNPFVYTGLNSGSHTVVIRDANGCIDTETIIINPPLSGTLTPSLTATQNCGVSDGIITVNAGGGSGNYTYSISPVAGTQAGNVFSNLPSGTYTITITDVTTTCFIPRTITLAQPTAPSFTESVVDVACNGQSNGSITITLTGSNPDPVYTYAITAGPVTFPAQNSNVFNNLPFGTYTVVVTSGRGCTTTRDINVGQPAPIVVPAPTVTQFTCATGTNTSTNASIVVTGVTGGSGTYINYVFLEGVTVLQSGTSNTFPVSNEAGGTYTINVYDNNGCLGTTTATIDPFIRISNPSTSVAPGDEITCTTLESITVNVDATINGTATALPSPISYTVTGFAPSTYNVTQIDNPYFTGLGIGNYTVTVLNQTTGCSVQTIHYVFNPNTFVVNATVNNNVRCFGEANGSVTFTFVDQNLLPSNNAGAFDYTIINTVSGLTVASGNSPTAGPFTVNNLPAGVYQLQTVLTGNPNCPAITNFTITQPTTALSINATNTPITCNGNDGSISAVGTDGWGGPYEYQLELGATVISAWSSISTFNNLAPGTYTVSVRDILGCPVPATVILVNPTPITATIVANPTALLCVGDTNATITVSGTIGGFGSGYLYTLNNVTTGTSSAPQTSNIFTNLGAGTYNVTITDSFNCTFTSTNVTITEPADNVVASLVLSSAPTCLNQAVLSLTASGGTPPYRYSTTPTGTYSPLTNPTTFTVAPGTYQYYVIDANNCIQVVSNSITVEPVIPLAVTVDTTNAEIECNGGTANVTALATNGLGNYIYTLNPLGITNTTGVFTNVPAGTYTVQVTSGDCIVNSAPFNIAEPSPITYTSSFTNLTCASFDNGTITVVATGGTGTIQYSISTQLPPVGPLETVNSGVFENLAIGTYYVFVQDQSGCSPIGSPISFTIDEPSEVRIVDGTFSAPPEICLGDGTTMSFTVTGGTPDAVVGYTTTLTDQNGVQTVQTSLTGVFSFSNLPAGEYDILTVDGNGCPLAFSYTLNPGIDIQGGVFIDYLCVNNAPNADVIVTYNDTDIALSDLTFSLDNGTPQVGDNVFLNVSDGLHSVVITHTNTCSQTVNFEVNLPLPLSVNADTLGLLNQFTMFPDGGTPPYTFTVSLNGNILYVGPNPVFFINQTGTYDILVTDANGCTADNFIFVEFFDILIPNFFTPVSDGWTPLYLDNFPNAITYVFDRYSRKLATLRPGQKWDGTYEGNALPTGDYWYVLKLNGDNDTREFVGNVALYR